MLWAETILTSTFEDEAGRSIKVIQFFKAIGTKKRPVPTPDSWTSEAINDVAIWVITLDEQASWALPEMLTGVIRSLYLYEGKDIEVAGEKLKLNQVGHINQSEGLRIKNGEATRSYFSCRTDPLANQLCNMSTL